VSANIFNAFAEQLRYAVYHVHSLCGNKCLHNRILLNDL